MVDENTDFFKIEDNFAKTAHIPSIPIIESKLDFVPKITIAIPTYKRAALLKEALDSAINQIGFDEYDIIVVDNNPERGCETEKLMLTYHEPRLSYYKNAENLGMVGNWNRCIALAKGEYLTILHDDDAIHPSFIEKATECILNKKMFFSFDVQVDQKIPYGFYLNRYTNEKSKYFRTTRFLFGNLSPFPGIVFKTEYSKSIGGFDETRYPIADYDFWIRLSLKYKCYKYKDKLAFYRISNIQETNKCYLDLVKLTWDKRKELRYFKSLKYISNYELYNMFKNYNPSEIDYYNLQKERPELYKVFELYSKIDSFKVVRFIYSWSLRIVIKILCL